MNKKKTVDSSQPFYFSTHAKEKREGSSVKHAKVEGSEVVREQSPVFHSRFYPRAQRSNNNTPK